MPASERKRSEREPDKTLVGLRRQATAAWRRLSRGWDDWLTIGRLIAYAQQAAQVRSQATRGPIYGRHLKRVMGSFHAHFEKISNSGAASFLARIMAEEEAVTAWRNRMPDAERLKFNHPQRVWEAYQDSFRSTIEVSEGDDDAEADEDDGDEGARGGRRGSFGRQHNSEQQLLAEIEAIKEQLDGHRMTIYPDVNAERIYRRIVETVGHDQAIPLLKATITELQALVGRVEGALIEYDDAKRADMQE